MLAERAADEVEIPRQADGGACMLSSPSPPAGLQAKSNKQNAAMLRARGRLLDPTYQLPTKTHDVLILVRGRPHVGAKCRVPTSSCTAVPG